MSASNRKHPLVNLIARHKRGRAEGIYSICSANETVLKAALIQAREDGSAACIEATSNQVDQFGGYTGMTPSDFAGMAGKLAARLRLPRARLILGGDHLGPNAWRGEAAASAMDKALCLVHAYTKAGFSKIHLDASMPCADDILNGKPHVSVETIAERTALLAGSCEKAGRPLYIIGTEVPRPGGMQNDHGEIEITSPADARETIEVCRKAFLERGLAGAWERVVAVVVQPGVEFGDETVTPYDRKKARPLSRFIERASGMVYEAHSTDYQPPELLRQMVEDHFAILKVGPELTFAFREAVFALADIEEAMLGKRRPVRTSDLKGVLDRVMVANPKYWVGYYRGTPKQIAHARVHSLSDRIRYYWANPDVGTSLLRLVRNLACNPAPLELLDQHLPAQGARVRSGALRNEPENLMIDKVMEVTGKYARACGLQGAREGERPREPFLGRVSGRRKKEEFR